jgi:hypothetical protein
MTAPEVIVFPDVEQVLCDWLTTALTAHGQAVPVSTRIPNPRPAKFVRLIRTGGTVGPVLVLDGPIVAIEAWAATESQAAALLQLTRGLIATLPGQDIGGVTFYRVTEVGGPGNLPDPVSDQARYTYTVSILLRGQAL